MASIVCIHPSTDVPGALELPLREMGHAPIRCEGFEQAARALEDSPVDLILAESHFPGGTALGLLQWLRDRQLDVPLIVMTSYSRLEEARAAMKQGALDYLTLPPRAETLRLAIGQALQVSVLRR